MNYLLLIEANNFDLVKSKVFSFLENNLDFIVL